MVRRADHIRASPPPVSTLRPPRRFKSSANPPSQQTPPSAQRPPNSQHPTVIPSSILEFSQREPSFDIADDDDPIEEFSDYEGNAASGAEARDTRPSQASQDKRASQNAFEVMLSSQASTNAKRRNVPTNPRWTDREDGILIKGIRLNWSESQLSRELEGKGPVHRTGSSIRGRKRALKEKLKLEATVPRAPESERRSEIKRRRWSPGEISILRNGIRDGIDAATLHRQKFPYRSLRSVEHMVQRRKRTVKKTPGGMPGALDRSSEGPMLSDDIPGGTGPFDVVEDDVEDDVEVDDRAQMPAGADDSRDQTPPQVPATLDAADPTLADGFDFASVRTAYVKLPAHAATMTATAEKPGRLRRPSAAKRRFAHAPQTTANEGPSTVMPGPISQSASEDDPPVAPEPEPKRRALFGDWSQEERWRDCMRKSGGDERLARRFLQDMNMTTDMFDAVLRKDEEAIASIRAERAQKELRWAIEDGRARRKQPAQGEPVVVNAEDIDDEVLREEDWEVDEEEDDDYMMDIQEDDPYDFQDSEDDMIRDREFEEIEDDEDEDALPVFAGRQTPVQVMQATVMGDGLPTPTRTIEKLMAFGIDSKQPTSSLPTTAPSETTMASTSRESDMSKSKRARRRARNTESRRQSGGARNKTASDRKSMSSFATPVVPVAAKKEKQKKAQPAKPLEQASSTSSSYGVEADNPFMTIVRNAHIPTPPRRRFEPARRRGTPSPPAWFANDDDEDDSDSNAGSE